MPLVNRLSSFANLHDLAGVDAPDDGEGENAGLSTSRRQQQQQQEQQQRTADSADDSSIPANSAAAAASAPRTPRNKKLQEHRSGGRRPNKADQPSLDVDDDDDGNTSTYKNDEPARSSTEQATKSPCPSPLSPSARKTWLNPSPTPNEARLTVVQITDVYTLDNFASLKTMLRTMRERQGPHGTVLSMLTGDFLVRTS